ncbi:MAG: redoxin domain-containing protein [Gemmatimonadota bacterium]|nr:redoxin domain-containing protein [Gemmatimonadota bacterium]
MRQPRLYVLPALVLMSACDNTRSHAELMGDAAADLEAARLDLAMSRFDSARTLAPDAAEAHRQYAELASYLGLNGAAVRAWERALEMEPETAEAWDGYLFDLLRAGTYEADRRYGEKLVQVLPDAMRYAAGHPGVYTNALEAAQDLGETESYRALLREHLESHPDDQVLLHHLGEADVALAVGARMRREWVLRKDGSRALEMTWSDGQQIVKDSLEAVLDELASRHGGDSEVAAPTLYRLAAGYALVDRERKKDRWLPRLLAAPDRGALAEELYHRDMGIELRALLSGPSADAMDELSGLIHAGLTTTNLRLRGEWMRTRYTVAKTWADRSTADKAPAADEAADEAGGPRGPPLADEFAEPLFDAVMDLQRWVPELDLLLSSLRALLHYGVEPRAVGEKARDHEAALLADHPGYLRPGSRGDAREEEREWLINTARLLQALALTQLGNAEEAGGLLVQLATQSPGSETLGEYGLHLLRTDQPADALDMLVEAVAHGGSTYRGPAEAAAAAAGLSPDVVGARLDLRRPIVAAEQARRAIGERLERDAPDLALADQNGVEWRLGDLTGKVVVLKFWATWCVPCLAEFPHFVKLLEKYGGDDEVVFLTVATEGSTRAGVNDILTRNGYTFPVLFDDGGHAVDFGISAFPTTFYLDPDGVIQYKREGFGEDGYERQTSMLIDALRRVGGGPE